MNDAHDGRPDDLMETQPPEHAIHPTHRCRILGMAVFPRTVILGIAVNVVSVSVAMRVLRWPEPRNITWAGEQSENVRSFQSAGKFVP
jgi:hypothetical protein